MAALPLALGTHAALDDDELEPGQRAFWQYFGVDRAALLAAVQAEQATGKNGKHGKKKEGNDNGEG